MREVFKIGGQEGQKRINEGHEKRAKERRQERRKIGVLEKGKRQSCMNLNDEGSEWTCSKGRETTRRAEMHE